MEECNRKASAAAFRANNQPGEDTDVMDLHGLYVKEAEQASSLRQLVHTRQAHSKLDVPRRCR